MRSVRYAIALLMLLLLLINSGINVWAMNTGFTTEEMPQADAKNFLDNVGISRLTNEPDRREIKCFSANEDGLVAIGCESFETKTVCVYTDDGNFQYGYRFQSSGSIGVELDKDTLYLFFVRSDVAVALDFAGNVISVHNIPSTIENNSYWNHTVLANSQQVGNREYTLKNKSAFLNKWASSYSLLVVTDASGEEHIVYDAYDVDTTQRVQRIVKIVIVVLLVGLFAVITVKRILYRHKKEWTQ